MNGPSKEEALQFALMLKAGLPASEAIRYFTSVEDPADLAAILKKWSTSRAVAEATRTLNGKSWTEMTLDEQIRAALDQCYASLAYFLFSHNYCEVGDRDKQKFDTARQALEAKLAGMAGKTDALTRFFDDLSSGRVKLGGAPSKTLPN